MSDVVLARILRFLWKGSQAQPCCTDFARVLHGVCTGVHTLFFGGAQFSGKSRKAAMCVGVLDGNIV